MKINTLSELQGFLNSTSASAPLAVKEMLSSQLEILNVIQSPTLADSAFSRIIDSLYHAKEACTNDSQKKILCRQFSSVIENLVFFLDAKFQFELSQNKDSAIDFFCKATNSFMRNLGNILFCSIETFGTVGKVAVDTFDGVAKDCVISINSAVSQGMNALGGSEITVSTDSEGKITVQKKQHSSEIANIIKDTANDANTIINDSRGKLRENTERQINDWTSKLSNVVIENFFSPKRDVERNELVSSFFNFARRSKKDCELTVNFYETICNVIEKLGKYQAIIGPSILISDMIERYVKVMKNTQERENKSKDLKNKYLSLAGPILQKISPFAYYFGGPIAMAAFAYNLFSKNQLVKGKVPNDTLNEYSAIAEAYKPVF